MDSICILWRMLYLLFSFLQLLLTYYICIPITYFHNVSVLKTYIIVILQCHASSTLHSTYIQCISICICNAVWKYLSTMKLELYDLWNFLHKIAHLLVILHLLLAIALLRSSMDKNSHHTSFVCALAHCSKLGSKCEKKVKWVVIVYKFN